VCSGFGWPGFDRARPPACRQSAHPNPPSRPGRRSQPSSSHSGGRTWEAHHEAVPAADRGVASRRRDPIDPPMKVSGEAKIERLGEFIVFRSSADPVDCPTASRSSAARPMASCSRCTTSTLAGALPRNLGAMGAPPLGGFVYPYVRAGGQRPTCLRAPSNGRATS
jgi:hypothetical protein